MTKDAVRCKAKTLVGKQCKNRAKEDGFCSRHKKNGENADRFEKSTYSPPPKSLFNLVVHKEKLNKNFNLVRTAASSEPARRMIDDVFKTYDDLDGNFTEQFQTTGFDNRILELYLFAYFSRSGFTIKLDYPYPDFMVERNGLEVGVEATTVNPPRGGAVKELGRSISDISDDDVLDYFENEMPIRFGSPLFSKLKKKYWEHEHCKDKPFVIVIEAFHEDAAQWITDGSLINYLYGKKDIPSWSEDGSLEITRQQVENHRLGNKEVPTDFFKQPDTENVSAVIFTNSATSSKFSRMGYQHGYGCDSIFMSRSGFWFNPAPFARDPTLMSYDLAKPPFVEPWGQGLVVFHNPSCKHPVPHDFFVHAVQGYVDEEERFIAEHSAWHPISSKTFSFHIGPDKPKLQEMPGMQPNIFVGAISKNEFIQLCPYTLSSPNLLAEEHGWYADDTGSFVGAVFFDKSDRDWGYVVLARDENFIFRCIAVESSLPSRDKARVALQFKIAKLLNSPQRIFIGGIPADA